MARYRTGIERMSDAYRRGYNRCYYEPESVNPYAPGTFAAHDWQSGVDARDAEQRGAAKIAARRNAERAP